MSAPTPRHEFAVRYRRLGWQNEKVAGLGTRRKAAGYAARVLAGGRPDLASLVLLRVERREVGAWEVDEVLVDEVER